MGPQGELAIPPAAWVEYGFQAGEQATFLPGSRTSGGFGLTTPRLLARATAPLQVRALAQCPVGEEGQIVMPAAVGVRPGDRLPAVRGSGYALGFVARGPIYDEALQHPDLERFVLGL